MSSDLDQQFRIGLAVLSVLVLAYSLLIVQQILLGVLAIAMIWGIYLFYHLVGVLARIAAALEQLAKQRADRGGDSSDSGQSEGSQSGTAESDSAW